MIIYSSLEFLSEPKNCMVSSFTRGTCVVSTECELSLEALSRGRHHRLGRCGFSAGNGKDTTICCPTTAIKSLEKPKKIVVIESKSVLKEADTRTRTKRKCQKCKSFSLIYVFQLEKRKGT